MSLNIFIFFMTLLLTHATENAQSAEYDKDETRQPRVNGRIVKLYSGPRPDPVYCSGEGFQADPVNCAIFYRCVKSYNGKYTVFRYQCGPGTVFDPETDICNHPRNTKRAKCGGIDAPLNEYTNEIDAIQSEIPSPISTKAPTFDQTAISTKRPWETTQRQNLESSSPYPWVTTLVSQRPALSNQPSSQSGDICTSDGFMGDSEDCRKFYRCVGNLRGGFIRYEYTCTESTIWDDDAQTCNHPWAVQRRRCGRGNLNDKVSTPNKPNDDLTMSNEIVHQQTQKNYGAKVPQTTRRPLPQLEVQNNYRDPSNNYNNVNYDNNYINSEIQKQDYTQDPKLTTKSQSYETSSLIPSSTTSEFVDSNYNHVYQSHKEKPNSQADNNKQDCKQSGFMGDKSNCMKFYRCVDNGKGGYIKYEFTCGEGTVWDSKIEACNHAWAVQDCKHQTPEQLGTTSTKSTQNYDSTTKFISTSTTTQNYYSTSSEYSYTEEDNGYGNQNQPTVSYPNMTTIASSSSPNCLSSGFIGDDNDCKKFYRCVDNGKGSYTKYEFSCGDGTLWDPEIEACNHAWAVKRCGGTTDINKVETTTSKDGVVMTTMSLAPTTTQKLPEHIDYESGYGKPETEKPLSNTTKNPQENEINQSNECKNSGFMGDQNDCKKFYRCVDDGNGSFTRYEFSCGDGTVWDPKIDACNHAWAVEKCGSANTPDENKETPSPILSDEETESIQTTESQKVTSSTETTSQSPTYTTGQITPAGDSNNCHSSGFMGDENDCQKFYRCVENGNGGFIRYEFTCGEGTAWDQSIEACNHKWAVKNCDNVSNNTSEPSFETSSTISMTTTDIENSQVQETTEKPSSSGSTTSSKDDVSSTTSSSLDRNKCKAEGFYGDTNDCKHFYRCVDNGKGGYIKYDFSCGDGTIWDQEIQACNHESDSNRNCSHSSSSSTMPQSPSTMSTTSSSVTYITDSSESTKTPLNSNDKCESEGFFENSGDCKKFYRCVDNGRGSFTKYDFSCGEGTIWVQEIQSCDHDDGSSNCTNTAESNIHPPTSESVEENHTVITTSSPNFQTEPIQQHDEYPSETISSKPPISNEKCSSEGFFANNNDCRQFYRCVDNGNGNYIKYDFTCGEGTAWDPDIQTCNHINEVSNCEKSSGNQGQSQPVMQDEGLSSNDENTATSSTEKSTNSSSESSKTCKEEGFFGNPDDCQKFFRCVDNGKGGYTKYDFTCGEGTIWDQDLTTCNHPQDVSNPKCKQSESSSSSSESDGSSNTSSNTSENSEQTSSTTTASTSQSSSGTTEGDQNSTNCSQENSSKKPENQNVTCTQEGYYPNPNDCKKFYRCVDWDGHGEKFSVYHFECGEGTIWDPALDTCNHEDSVYPPRNCSSNQSQNENQESSTSETTTTQEASTTTQLSSTMSTSEESTHQSTTSEQSTTNEQTTAQQTTTSEQSTTQQSTASEAATTQQSTTSEPTTTQQSTTSEAATTQQSTTSEPTTTQQSTTSEKTTTQQSTTSEQTTTQQSTTSEQTTTQQSTTSEQTTTQQSTTSEQTTTQQSTTSEQTTTQQSTTSEQTTTQQSTTSEQTQQSTTEQEITQQTTTQQSSTAGESTTTEGTTTVKEEQQNTTEQSTTTGGTEATTSSSTQQTNESSTTENSESTTESSSSTSDKCPKTDEDQNVFVCPTSFRRHPKYCNLFYQCTEDDDSHDVKVAVFHCPNNTIYDENQTKCVEESKANKKCDGEMAQRRRVKRLNKDYKEPIVVSKERMKCPTTGYFSFETEECSSVFLKCQKSKLNKLRGFVYKCPEGYLYWSVSKRCEKKSNIGFCKTSAVNNWNERWELPTERRNIAI